MSINALEDIKQIIKSNEELQEQLELLRQEHEGLKKEIAALEEKNKKFEPYSDIILDENAQKEWDVIHLRNPITKKMLQLRTMQIFHNTSPFSLASVANACLEYATSAGGWRFVVKNKYDNLRQSNGSRETEMADNATA